MDIPTKRSQWQHYADTSLPIESLIRLNQFSEVLISTIRLIQFQGWMVEQIEQKKIEKDLTDRQRRKILQIGMLDIVAKLMLLAESTLVLVRALMRKEGSNIAEELVRYEINVPRDFANMILNGDIKKEKLYGVLRLPDLGKLGLSKEERRFLYEVIMDRLNEFMESLTRISRFYLNHTSIYGKYRHGISLVIGWERSPANAKLPESVLMAVDRLGSDKRHFGDNVVEYKINKSTPDDLLMLLGYTDKSWKHYSQILTDIRVLVGAIVVNSWTRQYNCGEDYAPSESTQEFERQNMQFPAMPDGKGELLTSIMCRLGKNTFYENPQIPQSFAPHDDLIRILEERFSREPCIQIYFKQQ